MILSQVAPIRQILHVLCHVQILAFNAFVYIFVTVSVIGYETRKDSTGDSTGGRKWK